MDTKFLTLSRTRNEQKIKRAHGHKLVWILSKFVIVFLNFISLVTFNLKMELYSET
jgi:hypothetical protein